MNLLFVRSPAVLAFFVKLSAVLALVLGVFSVFVSVYFWTRFHLHFPVKDTLRLMPFVQNVLEHGFWSQSVGEWLAPHALAHRIAITRLEMVIDHGYFGGQNHVIYAATWLSILAMLVVFVNAFRRSYKSETVLFVFVVGLSLIYLFSYTQMENLINPINSSWYLALAGSVLSIFLITKQPTTPSVYCFSAAYLLAAVAAFSNFSGVIVWLLLPIFIAFRSHRAGGVAALLTAAFLTLYLQGLNTDAIVKPVEETGVASSDFGVTDFLHYTVAPLLMQGAQLVYNTFSYLGSPLSVTQPMWAALLVVFSFLLVAAGWWALVKQRIGTVRQHSPWFETTLAMATVTIGIAVATQFGRTFFAAPMADRYQTVVMVYWLSVCGLILYFGLNANNKVPLWQFASTGLCLAITALLLLGAPGSIVHPVQLAEAANRVSTLAFLDISQGVDDNILLPRKPPGILADLYPYFKKAKSGYAFNVKTQIPFDEFEECDHINISLEPSHWAGVMVATGQIKDQWSKWYRRIPMTTANGQVIGYIAPLFSNEVTPTTLFSAQENAWKGYLLGDKKAGLDIYLHYRTSLLQGKPCRLKL